MPRVRPLEVLALAMATACGPEIAPTAELDELCGQEAPVRLLALTPDERLWSPGMERVDGDRVVFEVVTRDPADANPYAFSDWSLRSVGSCGEDPVVLAADTYLFDWHDPYRDREEGVVLGCEASTGDVVVLDPDGRDAPSVLFSGLGCHPGWTRHGAVELRPSADGAAVVLHPYPEDPRAGPATPRTLLDALRGLEPHTVSILADEILALTAEDELVRIALPGGEQTLVQSGVRAFGASAEHIVWQALESPGGEPPVGAVYVRDRATGEDTFLVETALAHVPVSLVPTDVLVLPLGPWPDGPHRIVDLHAMTHVDLPEGERTLWRIEGQRWTTTDASSHSFIRHLGTGERTPFFDRPAQLFPTEGGAHAVGGALWSAPSAYGETGPMWFLPYDAAARQLANRVSQHRSVGSHDELVTVLDLDDDLVGGMFAIDPETLAERRLDENVFGPSLGGRSRALGDGSILYSVVDGDRSGVWRTRLRQRG